MNRVAVIAFCAASALATGSPASAIGFANAGFEDGTSFGWDLATATNTPGWTLISNSIFPRLNLNIANGGPFGNNNGGKQFVTIGGVEDAGTSAIEQTLTGFTSGQRYAVTWSQSSEFTFTDDLVVTITSGANSYTQTFSSNPYPCNGCYWQSWQTFSMPFTAGGGSATFHFQAVAVNSLGEPNYEVGVDDFAIVGNSVPEPAAWALLLSGFGLTGLAARRRGRAVAA